eukprot:CAMPEP_0114423082 /NCGR_PEP_ID=MMETSP0103-20121206/5956_1 /TAXON_ID=37642 ORGANISM="Paraphysomonas imperforata, Strain PA2" /NCGR_SAMPLE_ID=MMETSP0103 /ASSEMBLY_ACC=CAM_ASM_000201 /LENGTH=75 /DNA_ID=CAMNT_0001591715 /DNA_START=29 /DNA_END=256 /DNA_ORIENTATION=-
MTKSVVFDVGMTCGGCSAAVTRILKKVEGVEDIQCDLDEKKVTVVCDDETDEQLMLAKLMKWSEASGKSVALASA